MWRQTTESVSGQRLLCWSFETTVHRHGQHPDHHEYTQQHTYEPVDNGRGRQLQTAEETSFSPTGVYLRSGCRISWAYYFKTGGRGGGEKLTHIVLPTVFPEKPKECKTIRGRGVSLDRPMYIKQHKGCDCSGLASGRLFWINVSPYSI